MKVRYERLFKIADYEGETIGLEWDTGEQEISADEALLFLVDAVHRQHDLNRKMRANSVPEYVKTATTTPKSCGVAGAPVRGSAQIALPRVDVQGPPTKPVYTPPATGAKPAAIAPSYSASAYNRLAAGMAKPYTIQVPYKGPIDKDAATAYLKSLGYWFLGKKDGGDNGWHGEVFPDAMPELEAYMTKRPASQDPVGDAMGDDQINF